jgi:hypothetical protein
MAAKKRRGKHLELQTRRLQHWLWLRPRWCVCAKDQRKMKKFFGLLMLSALLTGCTTSITNLAPSHYQREPSGYYRVEAEWSTRREVVRPDSFKPLVVVNGVETYPMQRVPLVADRWQAYIPVPANQDMILYHYKFDFLDDAFGGPRPNSIMSRDYELHVK